MSVRTISVMTDIISVHMLGYDQVRHKAICKVGNYPVIAQLCVGFTILYHYEGKRQRSSLYLLLPMITAGSVI